MMKKITKLTKTLLVAAGLLVGTSAWATVYNGTTADYEVLFGTPVFTGEVITDVTPATEFTSDASEQNYTTMSLQISGSCLAGNQGGGRTYSFSSAPTTGKVYFKANGYFVGGNYNFFSIIGNVTDSEGTESETYKNIVQSPYALPSGSGETTVLRIFGQNITAGYVYTPRTVVYGFDVTIDIVNQKVDYTVTYASSGRNSVASALSTVSGSVSVPDGYTLNSVSSWSLPRISSSGNNYYDNVAFYSEVPTATLYSATFTETNGLTPTITIYSDAEMTEEVSNGYLTDGTTYYYKATLTGYDDKTGSFTVSGAAPSVSFTMEATPVYSYTVNAVDGSGNVLKQLASGSAYRGTTIYYHYNNVLNVNGTLLEADAVSSSYKSSFTLDTDNKVVTKVYSQPETPITNLVFLSEGEDLFTRGTGSTADTRCSMGAGGYAGSKTAFVTLPAGKYYLVLSNRCSGERTEIHKFYQGDAAEAFWAANGNGYNATRESGEFTLSSTTTLYMQGGDNNQYVDWLYIYGTPTNEIIGALDCSTGWKGATSTPLTMKPGDSFRYQFVNYTNGANVNDQNWQLIVADPSTDADIVEIRADWWENLHGSSSAEHQQGFSSDAANYWTNVPSKMNGATVDMIVTFNVDKTFTMTSTTTAADNSATWTYNWSSASAYETNLKGYNSLKVYLTCANNWLELTSEAQTAVGAKIGDTGWTTFASASALDLSGMTASTGEVTAYYASSVGTSSVKMTSTDKNDVIAGEGLMLKGNVGAIITIPVVASGTAIDGNLLKGCTVETVLGKNSISGYNNYVLVNNGGTAEFQSLVENGATIPAGKAYLQNGTYSAGARSLSIVFADESTGIEAMQNDACVMHNEVYNLNGQRVQMPQKGLYIVGGKKVMMK